MFDRTTSCSTHAHSALRPHRARVIAALALAAFTFGLPVQAESVRLAGTGSGMGTMEIMAAAYRKQDSTFALSIVPFLGSRGSLKALLDGALDIAVISRELSRDEEASGLTAFEYGRTPFVLATSRKDLKGITVKEATDIYAGKVTQWPDGKPIRLVLRPKSVVATTLLSSWSPEMKRAVEAASARPGMVVAPSDQESAAQIARMPGSLGTSTLAIILTEKHDIHALPLDGVTPSAAAIRDKTYPYSRVMRIVTKGHGSQATAKFVDFVRSPEGRAELQRIGHWVRERTGN